MAEAKREEKCKLEELDPEPKFNHTKVEEKQRGLKGALSKAKKKLDSDKRAAKAKHKQLVADAEADKQCKLASWEDDMEDTNRLAELKSAIEYLKVMPDREEQEITKLGARFTTFEAATEDEIQRVESDEKAAIEASKQARKVKTAAIQQACHDAQTKAKNAWRDALMHIGTSAASTKHVGTAAITASPASAAGHPGPSLAKLGPGNLSLQLKNLLKTPPGRYGWVYSAEMTVAGAAKPTRVVLKISRDSGGTQADVSIAKKMFGCEAETLKKLARNPHPNVVAPLYVHDAENEDGAIPIAGNPKATAGSDKPPPAVQRVLVLPYYGDTDLAGFIRTQQGLMASSDSSRCDLCEVSQMARDVAAALAHVHKLGVCHRDLHPGNVMVTVADGKVNVVKLIDFSHVKLGAGASQQHHSAVGTSYVQDTSCELSTAQAVLRKAVLGNQRPRPSCCSAHFVECLCRPNP